MNACDAFRVYLLSREFKLRTEPSAVSAIFNSPLCSTIRVAKWLLALQPFGFTVNHIKGEENVAADNLSRIPRPVAMAKAVEIVQLAGDLEHDTDAEEEPDSDTEGKGE